jgi:hypothetical protein
MGAIPDMDEMSQTAPGIWSGLFPGPHEPLQMAIELINGEPEVAGPHLHDLLILSPNFEPWNDGRLSVPEHTPAGDRPSLRGYGKAGG